MSTSPIALSPPCSAALAASLPLLPTSSPIPHPTSRLLFDFLSGSIELTNILAEHKLTPTQLRDWINTPQVQAQLEAVKELSQLRAELIATCLRPHALSTLFNVTAFAAQDPLESRRAATTLLRASSPSSSPRTRTTTASTSDGAPGALALAAPLPFSLIPPFFVLPTPAPTARRPGGGRVPRPSTTSGITTAPLDASMPPASMPSCSSTPDPSPTPDSPPLPTNPPPHPDHQRSSDPSPSHSPSHRLAVSPAHFSPPSIISITPPPAHTPPPPWPHPPPPQSAPP